jgi:hypothetical protein
MGGQRLGKQKDGVAVYIKTWFLKCDQNFIILSGSRQSRLLPADKKTKITA